MKRMVATLSLLIAGAALVAAETVMVAVNEGAPPPEEEPSARYYLSAAEAGAMDVFFDAGHIVFNAGTYSLDEEESVEKRYEVRSMARDGGAGYALHIEMAFDRPGPETIRPRSARYTMMATSGSRVIKSGTVSIDGDTDEAPEQLSFKAGKEIAQAILSAW
jgi:hypothetical protein